MMGSTRGNWVDRQMVRLTALDALPPGFGTLVRGDFEDALT